MQGVVNVVNVMNIMGKAFFHQLFPAHPVVERAGDMSQLLPVISHARILQVIIFVEYIHTISLRCTQRERRDLNPRPPP